MVRVFLRSRVLHRVGQHDFIESQSDPRFESGRIDANFFFFSLRFGLILIASGLGFDSCGSYVRINRRQVFVTIAVICFLIKVGHCLKSFKRNFFIKFWYFWDTWLEPPWGEKKNHYHLFVFHELFLFLQYTMLIKVIN